MKNPNLIESSTARNALAIVAVCGALASSGCKNSSEATPIPANTSVSDEMVQTPLSEEFSLDADSDVRFRHPENAKQIAEDKCNTIFAAARCNTIDMSDLPGRGREQIAGNQKRLTGQAGLMLFEHQTTLDKNSPTGKKPIVVSYDDSGSYKNEEAFYSRDKQRNR